jgi:hypothetical protein
LRPDVKHPHLEPFTEWEAAVIVQAQREMGNNWLGEQQQLQYRTLSPSCILCHMHALLAGSTWHVFPD